jgi:TPR repeat protein
MGWAGVLLGLRWPRLPNAGHGRALMVTAAVLAVAGPLMSCDDGGWWWRHNRLIGGACPRPQWTPDGQQPQFGAQQIEIRALRERAFRGDFFAQLELGRRYQGSKATEKNLEDPIEAAVWLGMALANETGYAPIASRGQEQWSDRLRAVAHFDDCRAFERGEAYHSLDRLLSRMSTDERDQVRDRIIYVLSTQGADGYRTLARLHDLAFGPYGEPLDNGQGLWARGPTPDRAGAPAVLGMFQRNDVDAYMYNYLAAQSGDVGAFVLLKDFERSSPERAGYANFVQAKADRWVPPYEFYPPQAPLSGVPHSDESKPVSEAAELALARIHDLPFSRIADAMVFLRIIPKICDEDYVTKDQVRVLQAMLGRPQTGYLTALEKVRAVQYAATNGSAKAQLVLAVMYAEGIGVQTDYARAFHWFAEADKQGSAEAKYAMSQYFSLGVQGVADQDKAKAVVYQIDSALSGFHPTAEKLAGILQRMNRFGRTRYGPPAYGPQPYGPAPYGPPPGYPPSSGYVAPSYNAPAYPPSAGYPR